MNRILRNAKRAVLCLGICAIALTITGQSRAQYDDLTATLAETSWMRTAQDANGMKVGLGIHFQRNGGFEFVKVDSTGKLIGKVTGYYRTIGRQAFFYVNGEVILAAALTFDGPDTLVSTTGTGAPAYWVRLK